MKNSGIDITICYNEILPLYRFDEIYRILGKKIFKNVEDGLDTYRYIDFNYLLHSKLRFSVFSRRIEKLINRIIKDKGKIDLIHFHSCFWAGISAPFIKHKFNIPYVLTEHTSIYNSKKILKSYFKYIGEAYLKANKVISVSKYLKDEIFKTFNVKDISVINNFIDGNRFKIINNKFSNKRFVFFSLAFLVEGKGFEELIQACEILLVKGYDFLLEIGGDGYLREKLESYVKNRNLHNNVIFLGMLTREEVVKRMNKCNAFVLASTYETFGVVYIEALACGKPVIAVKNGGSEEIVNKEVGILLNNNGDLYIKLADAMIDMICNIGNYDESCIRKYFLDNFEREVIIGKLKDVYKNCLRI